MHRAVRLQLEVAVPLRVLRAPGTRFVGTVVDRLDLLAACASPIGQRGALLLAMDADLIVVGVGAGRLVDLAARLATHPWEVTLLVGPDEGDEELAPGVLLASLEAVMQAHPKAARLTYVPTELVYDLKAAAALLDGAAGLHLWLGRTR